MSFTRGIPGLDARSAFIAVRVHKVIERGPIALGAMRPRAAEPVRI